MRSEEDLLRAEIQRLKEENKSLREDAVFKPIFNHSPLGVFRSSHDGKILEVNQTLCDILHYDNPEDLISSVKDISRDIYANECDRDLVLNKLKKAGDYTRFELEFKRKNGEVFTGMMSIKMIKGKDGNIKYLEGTLEDISPYRQAELERRNSENLYKTLINTMSDTIVISDISGKIEFVSESVLKLTSSESQSDLIGSNILDWLAPKHHHKAKENIHKVVNNLPYNFEEYELIRKDGTSLFAEIRTTVIANENGRPSKLISIIQDISGRKETESILRQTQELYRTIIELSPAGLLILNAGEVVFLNKALAEIFDTSNQWDLVGKNIQDYIHDRYKEAFERFSISYTKLPPDQKIIQLQVKSLKGETKDVMVSASSIFYDGEDCLFLFVNDITKRVKMEKELNRDRHMMETFWNHLPDSITFKNKDGQYIKVNETFKKWVNIKDASKLLHLTDRDLFDKSYFEKATEEERKVIENGKIIVNKIQQESWPDNKNKWVSLTKMPLYDLEKNIIGVFSLTRDITQEHNAKIEIRDRERWLRSVFDHSPVAKIILSTSFKIKQGNQSFVDLLGEGVEKFMGKSILKLFERQEEPLIGEALKQMLTSNDTSKFQLESRIKIGATGTKNVIVQGVYLNDLGTGEGEILMHLIDIHKRKLAEDLLMVRNNELNNFVYKVSHDLRAPLTSIKGIINLIRLEKDPAVFYQYIQMISERIERLDLFIRDVLSHSKNLNVELKFEKIDLQSLIDECVGNIVYQDSKLNVSRIINIKGKPFYSDYHRVHEIMRNLISNAFQYSKKDVADAFVKIEIKTTKKYSRIIIQDNGVGIKKKFQPYIFNMFYRANEKVEGSGLGLYIVKLSVEKLQGEIKMQSSFNKGTTFEIILPNVAPC